MATIKIYNDIAGEEEKLMLQQWEGMDSWCYKDIEEFLGQMSKEDPSIEIRLHCRGGDCIEGWAIYDKLRQSGKEISCTVEGECSSMATIILMAAPLERRFAYENAHFCVHAPALGWMPETDLPARLTADALQRMISQMQSQTDQLRREEERMLDLYELRTTATREELRELMARDEYIDAPEALRIGLVSQILPAISAKKEEPFLNTNTIMNKKSKISAKRSALRQLLAKAGLAEFKAQVVTAADGSELTVERQEGDPQVGDEASPDGSFVLADGTTIVVTDGTITSILAPLDDAAQAELKAQEEASAELVEKIEELIQENGDLQEKLEELQQQLDAKKEARVLSQEETEILDKVSAVGGLKWLEEAMEARSSFNASGRRFTETGASSKDLAQETRTQQLIRQKKEAAAAKRASRQEK